MKYRRLGKTDLQTSEIGLGCWALGGLTIINGIPTTYGDVRENQTFEVINSALELGINTFDTADVYSLGNSERRLGRIIRDKRKSVYIFTKAGGVPSYGNEKPYEIDLSYHHLISALHRSLKRLETDYVDLFQVHVPPKSESEYKNIEKAFSHIKQEGLARYCGVSIGKNYEQGIELIKRGLVDSLQLYFSLFEFNPIDILLPLAKKNGIGIIIAEPLAQGILTGKYHSVEDFNSLDIRSRIDKKEIQEKIEFAKKMNFLQNGTKTLSQAALAYILERDEVSTCIPNSKTIEQLKMNVGASEIRLTKTELEKVQTIQDTFKQRNKKE